MNKAEELIACLEGEIAKRDEELAACRVAVENCEVFRARIAELESQFDGESIVCGSYRDERDAALAELAAIKAQEPVAWISKDGTYAEASTKSTVYGSHTLPLYAEPVPVENAQVVMPERWNVPRPMWKDVRQPYGNPLNHADIEAAEKFNLALDEVARLNAIEYAAPGSEAKAQGVVMPPSPYMPGSQPTDFTDYELGEIHGRIAMWEEVKRLNAAPVQKVSMPDGKVCVPVEVLRLYEFMAASFTPFTSQHEQIAISLRRAKAAMLAAPAAPAADAGIVDMYRHLQKVTPYRFKKIQDASITDGGDVMYFHKDRFDAALLADMAANRANGVV